MSLSLPLQGLLPVGTSLSASHLLKQDGIADVLCDQLQGIHLPRRSDIKKVTLVVRGFKGTKGRRANSRIVRECTLSVTKRTSGFALQMSAFDP